MVYLITCSRVHAFKTDKPRQILLTPNLWLIVLQHLNAKIHHTRLGIIINFSGIRHMYNFIHKYSKWVVFQFCTKVNLQLWNNTVCRQETWTLYSEHYFCAIWCESTSVILEQHWRYFYLHILYIFCPSRFRETFQIPILSVWLVIQAHMNV